ncbi:hypothetical protein FJR11_19525 [Anabaena sp. UHCC 0187]|uniref:hypothetical protein n=1 Tax=Anabaena sp. UHCC 0187 TaxID=2590018 RepID=UPI0014460192|nr:hypothetical protein [Anabaena sp. UHCC 0187]MTJ14728.1 hypothetical protein [Anabaena sp. UHCC 0187]
MFTASEYQTYLSRLNRRQTCHAINIEHDMLLAVEVYAVQFGSFNRAEPWNGEELTFQFYLYQHDSKRYLGLKVDDSHFGIVGEAFRHPRIPCQPWQGKVYSSSFKDDITTGVFIVNSDVAHLFI